MLRSISDRVRIQYYDCSYHFVAQCSRFRKIKNFWKNGELIGLFNKGICRNVDILYLVFSMTKNYILFSIHKSAHFKSNFFFQIHTSVLFQKFSCAIWIMQKLCVPDFSKEVRHENYSQYVEFLASTHFSTFENNLR